jgi:acyl carrier protein
VSTTQSKVSTTQLEARLLRSVRDRLGIEIPSAEVDLLESGLLDSLTFVELLVMVEEKFGVAVDLAELELDDFRSVRSIAAFVQRERAAGSGAG